MPELPSPTDRSPELRVVISAYAFGPVDEPEAGAGWAIATAAARRHLVTVITRDRFRGEIEAGLAADPELAARLQVVYLEVPVKRLAAMRRTRWNLYPYYVLWQRTVARHVREYALSAPIDVVHHVTFANDWLPCGVGSVHSIPLVWGPVGGSTTVPLRHLAAWLGPRGTATEVIRIVATGIVRRFIADPVARRAALVVAQNDDVARRFRRARRVVVEPNASLAPDSDSAALGGTGQTADGPVAIHVARLLSFKGGRLAVAAMAEPALSGWRLRIYGSGPDRAVMERLAQRLGVADRIEFLGHRPRAEVLAAYRTANAMLFPSMHDQAGWAAAEASAAGLPVICLPLGGPPLLAGPNAVIVPIDRKLVPGLAAATAKAGDHRGEPYLRWTADRFPELVDTWYRAALDTGPL